MRRDVRRREQRRPVKAALTAPLRGASNSVGVIVVNVMKTRHQHIDDTSVVLNVPGSAPDSRNHTVLLVVNMRKPELFSCE